MIQNYKTSVYPSIYIHVVRISLSEFFLVGSVSFIIIVLYILVVLVQILHSIHLV